MLGAGSFLFLLGAGLLTLRLRGIFFAIATGLPLGGNLVNLRYQFAQGDVESAFARAHVVVEGDWFEAQTSTASPQRPWMMAQAGQRRAPRRAGSWMAVS